MNGWMRIAAALVLSIGCTPSGGEASDTKVDVTTSTSEPPGTSEPGTTTTTTTSETTAEPSPGTTTTTNSATTTESPTGTSTTVEPPTTGEAPVFDCSGPSAVFCEDFEDLPDFAIMGDGNFGVSQAPDGSGWTDVLVGAHEGEPLSLAYLSRDEEHAHRGAAGLRSAVDYRNPLTAWSQMRHHVDPLPELYMRVFVLVPAATLGNEMAITWLAEDTGNYYASIGLELGTDGHLHLYGFGDTYADDVAVTDPAALPTDTWVCLEMRIRHGDAPSFTAWRDDAEIVAEVPLTLGERVLSQAMFGQYGIANNQDGVEVFYDDIVLATERVGCEL